jgi:hypothetical protein
MRSTAVLALAAAAAGVSAQLDAGYKSALDMTLSDPNSVSISTRADWCRGQFNTCETLCGDNTKDNDCDENNLSYKCNCAKNGSAPGLQFYKATMPSYLCEALYGQCKETNVGNSQNQKKCDTQIEALCPKNDPPKNPVNSEDDGDDDEDESSSQTSSSTAPTAAPTQEGNGDENESAPSTTTSDGFAAPTLAPAGNGVAAIAAIGLLAYLI